eukprot:scaffold629994_cov42-Prasinocladus_malaysianus.AAC.1
MEGDLGFLDDDDDGFGATFLLFTLSTAFFACFAQIKLCSIIVFTLVEDRGKTAAQSKDKANGDDDAVKGKGKGTKAKNKAKPATKANKAKSTGLKAGKKKGAGTSKASAKSKG